MVRKARLDDVPAIHQLINEHAERGLMLFRAPAELYEHLRDFYVGEVDGEVVGCCALEIMWRDLAEIKSLSVAPSHQRRGIGAEMIQAALHEAARLGLARVFALTRAPDFFTRLGFEVVDRQRLPHKIWDDCVRCDHRDDCDEIAVIHDVAPVTQPA
jgi:amino-acid N-acetyltransferase